MALTCSYRWFQMGGRRKVATRIGCKYWLNRRFHGIWGIGKTNIVSLNWRLKSIFMPYFLKQGTKKGMLFVASSTKPDHLQGDLNSLHVSLTRVGLSKVYLGVTCAPKEGSTTKVPLSHWRGPFGYDCYWIIDFVSINAHFFSRDLFPIRIVALVKIFDKRKTLLQNR